MDRALVMKKVKDLAPAKACARHAPRFQPLCSTNIPRQKSGTWSG